MFDIYKDYESTDVNPYIAEAIEGSFLVYLNGEKIDEYFFCSQVLKWSEKAQEIHKIPYAKMLTYPIKETAYRNLLQWLSQYKGFRFVTYANKNSEYGHLNYDCALMENELDLLGCPNYYLKNKFNMRPNYSVHKLARECAKKKIFSYITQIEAYKLGFTTDIKHKTSTLPARQLPSLYYALFNEFFDAHSCIADTKALVRIHKELLKLSNENQDLLYRIESDNS